MLRAISMVSAPRFFVCCQTDRLSWLRQEPDPVGCGRSTPAAVDIEIRCRYRDIEGPGAVAPGPGGNNTIYLPTDYAGFLFREPPDIGRHAEIFGLLTGDHPPIGV